MPRLTVYNEAFNAMIRDNIKDYEIKTRILYQYGIETELEQETGKTIDKPLTAIVMSILS